MNALILEKKGLENLVVKEVKTPSVSSDEVMIRVSMVGIQAQDYIIAQTMSAYGENISPIPHILGEEIVGTVEDVGDKVRIIKKGDRVIVYHRIFDETCDLCKQGMENLCRNRGRIGINTNGGLAEFVVVKEHNVIKIGENLDEETAVSLPVSIITPYHALVKARVGLGDNVVVFGASGNTGMFAVQIAKRLGAKVIAVSRGDKSWLMEFGADILATNQNIEEQVIKSTEGRGCDVVVYPLGKEMWETALKITSYGGRIIAYGALTGGMITMPLVPFYKDEITLYGTRGGTRNELQRLSEIATGFRTKVWKKYSLEESASAIADMVSPDRQGRLLVYIE